MDSNVKMMLNFVMLLDYIITSLTAGGPSQAIARLTMQQPSCHFLRVLDNFFNIIPTIYVDFSKNI